MGRKQKPLAGTSAVVLFAAQLRQIRAAASLTVREVAARSGYAHSTVSKAEAGSQLPSWQVTEAFVQACGLNPAALRPAWQAAHDAGPQGTPAAPGTASPPPAPATHPPPRATARIHPALLTSLAAIVVAVAAITIAWPPPTRPRYSTPPAPPSATARAPELDQPPEPPSAPAGKTILKQGITVLRAGQELDLDAKGPNWPHATGASSGPWDIEFTLAYRNIEGEAESELANIPAPTNSYNDCLTSNYAGVVPASAVKKGTEFCMITTGEHRALVTIIGTQKDNGKIISISLYVTTWSCKVVNDVCG